MNIKIAIWTVSNNKSATVKTCLTKEEAVFYVITSYGDAELIIDTADSVKYKDNESGAIVLAQMHIL